MASYNNLVSIYKSIFTKIDTLLDANGKKVFKNRYVWNDQVKRMVKGLDGVTYNVYNTPCLYIEMIYGLETPLSEGVSRADLTLKFHIVMMELDAMNNTLDQNVNIFTLRDLINNNFVLYFAPQTGPFQYLSEKLDYNHGNIYHYVLSYKTHYIDTVAYQVGSTMSVTYGLTVSVIEQIKSA